LQGVELQEEEEEEEEEERRRRQAAKLQVPTAGRQKKNHETELKLGLK
jgi:hypothetical protein